MKPYLSELNIGIPNKKNVADGYYKKIHHHVGTINLHFYKNGQCAQMGSLLKTGTLNIRSYELTSRSSTGCLILFIRFSPIPLATVSVSKVFILDNLFLRRAFKIFFQFLTIQLEAFRDITVRGDN